MQIYPNDLVFKNKSKSHFSIAFYIEKHYEVLASKIIKELFEIRSHQSKILVEQIL